MIIAIDNDYIVSLKIHSSANYVSSFIRFLYEIDCKLIIHVIMENKYLQGRCALSLYGVNLYALRTLEWPDFQKS